VPAKLCAIGAAERASTKSDLCGAIRRQHGSAGDEISRSVPVIFRRAAGGLPIIPGRALGFLVLPKRGRMDGLTGRRLQVDSRESAPALASVFASLRRDRRAAAPPDWPVSGSRMTTPFAGQPRVHPAVEVGALRLATK